MLPHNCVLLIERTSLVIALSVPGKPVGPKLNIICSPNHGDRLSTFFWASQTPGCERVAVAPSSPSGCALLRSDEVGQEAWWLQTMAGNIFPCYWTYSSLSNLKDCLLWMLGIRTICAHPPIPEGDRGKEMDSLYQTTFVPGLHHTFFDGIGPNTSQHLSSLELGSLKPRIISYLNLALEYAETSLTRRPSPWCVTSRAEKDLS